MELIEHIYIDTTRETKHVLIFDQPVGYDDVEHMLTISRVKELINGDAFLFYNSTDPYRMRLRVFKLQSHYYPTKKFFSNPSIIRSDN